MTEGSSLKFLWVARHRASEQPTAKVLKDSLKHYPYPECLNWGYKKKVKCRIPGLKAVAIRYPYPLWFHAFAGTNLLKLVITTQQNPTFKT